MMGSKSKWLAGLTLALMLMAAPVYAGQPFRVFIPVDNDTATNADDQAKVVKLEWYDDEPRFYLKEFQTGLNSYSSIRSDDITNPNGIQSMQIFNAINEALATWNGARWAKFKFFDTVIPGRLARVPGTDYIARVPAIDGINLISFLEPAFGNTLVGDTSITYFRRDIDFDELLASGSDFPFQIVSVYDESGILLDLITVDLDLDGDPDLFLPTSQREFKAGTIFDTDIVVNLTAIPHMHAWPENRGDVPANQEHLVVGSLDVQAVMTNLLGQARGLADSMIIDSAMYPFFEDETAPFPTDPYRRRKLAYDDEIAVGLTDGASFGGQYGTISGQIIEGAAVDGFQDEGGGVDVLDVDEPVVMIPVFLCVRPESVAETSLLKSGRPQLISGNSPDDVIAAPLVPDPNRNSGTWRKIAQVLSGQNLVISAGQGLPLFSTLDPGDGAAGTGDPIFFPIPDPGQIVDPGTQPGGIGGGVVGGVLPDGTAVLLPSAEQINSKYIFPGVPPTTDAGTPIKYALRIENNTTVVPDAVYQIWQASRPETFPDEFYGGPLAQIDAGNGTFGRVPIFNDDIFGNFYIGAQVDENGRFAGEINIGMPFLSGFGVGPKSYFQVKSPRGTFTNRLTNIGIPEAGRTIDELAGTSNASWLRPDDFLVQQDISITLDGGIAGTPDGLRVSYTLTNKSAQTAPFSLTQYLDTYLFGSENPIYTVNLLPVDNATSFNGAEVPAEIRYQTSLLDPAFTAFLQLRGFGLNPPDRVTIAALKDLGKNLTGSTYALRGPNAVNLDSGISLTWENVPLLPEEARTFSFIIGFLPVGRLLDTWFPLTAIPAEGEVLTGQEDDPGRVEVVTVEPGEVRDGINIVTNTGALSANTTNASQTEGSATGSLLFQLQQDGFPQTSYLPSTGALGDIDNDGDLDLVVAGFPGGADPVGSGIKRLYENRQRINVDGSISYFFVDVTFGPDGIPGTLDDRLPGSAEKTLGVVLADFDLDGDLDLYFSNRDGQDRFYVNIGFPGSLDIAGKFEDHSVQWLPGLLNRARPFVPGTVPGGLNNPLTQGNTFRAVAGDIDSDGDLDLIISHNLPYTDERWTADGLALELLPSQAFIDGQDGDDHPYDGFPDGSVDYYSVDLEWTESVLINMTRRTPYQIMMGKAGGSFFNDETLGEDNRAGIKTDLSFPPPPFFEDGLVVPANVALVGSKIDRMPPIFPITMQTNRFGETIDIDDLAITVFDSPMGHQAVQPILGNFFQSSALDLFSIRSFASAGPVFVPLIPITRHFGDPIQRVNDFGFAFLEGGIPAHGQEPGYYRNTDLFSNSTGLIGRDNIADGYFACLNYGMDPGTDNRILFGSVLNNPQAEIAYDGISFNPETGARARRPYRSSLVTYDYILTPLGWDIFQDYMPLAIGVPDAHPGDYELGDTNDFDMVTHYDEAGQASAMMFDWDNTGTPHALIIPSPLHTANAFANPPFFFEPNVADDFFFFDFSGQGWRHGINEAIVSGWANPYFVNAGTMLAGRPIEEIADPWQATEIPYASEDLLAGQGQYAIHEDFNLDGFEDFFLATGSTEGPVTFDGGVTAADNPQRNQIWAGTGRADNFVEAPTALVPNPPTFSSFALAGDIDNDGDKDIIALNILQPNQLYMNQAITRGPDLVSTSDPTLFYEATHKMIPPLSGATLAFPIGDLFIGATGISVNTTIGDLDGDGKPDLAIAEGGMLSEDGDNFRVMFNRGSYSMPHGEYVFQPAGSNYPAPMLSNTAGQLITSQTLPGQSIFTGLVNNGFYGAGTFPFTVFAYYRDIAIGDVDNDGDQDIVAIKAANEIGESTLFSPTGPELYRNFDSDNPSVNSIPDSDSIGDGVFRLDPGGTPALIDRQGVFGVSLKNQGRRIRLADVNHDGLLDGIVANGYEDNGAPNVLMLNVGGSFTDATDGPNNHLPVLEPNGRRYGVLDNTVDLAVADFDHDGNMDIVFINASNTNVPVGFRLLDGDAAGRFTETTGRFKNEAGVTTTFQLTRPWAVAVGDLDGIGEQTEDKNYNGVLDPGEDTNGNGVIDWIDLPSETEDVNGNGVLDPGEDVGIVGALGTLVGAGDGSITSFDTNNDGIITSRRPGVWEGSLDLYVTFQDVADKILINDPTNQNPGTFTDRTPLLVPNPGIPGASRGVSIGDIDLDGDPDVVVARFVGGVTRPVRLWMNSTLVLPNGNVRRGVLTERSHEVPFNRSMRQVAFIDDVNVPEADGENPLSLTGWAIDVDLIDIDGDGDLDIFVTGLANSGRITVIGSQEAVYINRLIGEGFQHETRQNIKSISSPAIFQVTPRGSNRGKTLQTLIEGAKFSPGTRFDFGAGIQAVVDSIDPTGSRANVTLTILAGAPYGPRRVIAEDPLGGVTATKSGAFYVYEALADGIQTDVPNLTWTLYE